MQFQDPDFGVDGGSHTAKFYALKAYMQYLEYAVLGGSTVYHESRKATVALKDRWKRWPKRKVVC